MRELGKVNIGAFPVPIVWSKVVDNKVEGENTSLGYFVYHVTDFIFL